MADLAEFESTPTGTERKKANTDSWLQASVGDKLGNGDECRNTQGSTYRILLYGEAMVEYDVVTTVALSNITDIVKYLDTQAHWVQVTNSGQYNAQAVGTEIGGGVAVVCSLRGFVKPPPWKVNP